MSLDLLGTNPLYRISGLKYKVNKNDQKHIKFPQAAYPTSIEIKRYLDDGTIETFPIGFYSSTGCDDEATMAQVNAAVTGWNKTVVDGVIISNLVFDTMYAWKNGTTVVYTPKTKKSLGDQAYTSPTLITAVGAITATDGSTSVICNSVVYSRYSDGDTSFADILFSVSYQSVFANVLTSAVDQEANPNGPVCTPELLKRMVEDLAYLKSAMDNSTGMLSLSSSLPTPCGIDYTGTLEANYIVDEDHHVDTTEGKVVICPMNGPFFGYDVVVKKADGTVLVNNTDYTIRGLDVEATKVCEHSSGVWRYIVINVEGNISGTLYITYHSFGGAVSVNGFIALRNYILNMQNYLNTGGMITASTLGGTSLMQSVMERLKTHDRYQRSLELSGFRDMSTIYSATSPNGVNDGNGHWYRVAYLYKQINTPDDQAEFQTYTRDSIRLKISLKNAGMFFDMFVYANVTTGVLKADIVEVDNASGYSLLNEYSSSNAFTVPEFRLVWRTDGNYTNAQGETVNAPYWYGAVLQIKLKFPTDSTSELVTVENHNKASMGGWILRGDANGTDNVPPEDTTVLLPDGIHTWLGASGEAIYKSRTIYPSYPNGITLWAGSIPMTLMDMDTEGFVKVTRLDPCCTEPLHVGGITSLQMVAFDRYAGEYVKSSIAIGNLLTDRCIGRFNFDPIDHSFFEIEIGSETPAISGGDLILTYTGTELGRLLTYKVKAEDLNGVWTITDSTATGTSRVWTRTVTKYRYNIDGEAQDTLTLYLGYHNSVWVIGSADGSTPLLTGNTTGLTSPSAETSWTYSTPRTGMDTSSNSVTFTNGSSSNPYITLKPNAVLGSRSYFMDRFDLRRILFNGKVDCATIGVVNAEIPAMGDFAASLFVKMAGDIQNLYTPNGNFNATDFSFGATNSDGGFIEDLTIASPIINIFLSSSYHKNPVAGATFINKVNMTATSTVPQSVDKYYAYAECVMPDMPVRYINLGVIKVGTVYVTPDAIPVSLTRISNTPGGWYCRRNPEVAATTYDTMQYIYKAGTTATFNTCEFRVNYQIGTSRNVKRVDGLRFYFEAANNSKVYVDDGWVTDTTDITDHILKAEWTENGVTLIADCIEGDDRCFGATSLSLSHFVVKATNYTNWLNEYPVSRYIYAN